MSSTDAPLAPPPTTPVRGALAAWLATAIGIPLYAVVALALASAAAPLARALAPDRNTVEDLGMFLGVAVTNVAVALVGIPVVAHTLGRVMFSRTSRAPDRAAARGFVVMGALLAAPLVVFIAYAQPLHAVGGLYAALAVGVPCGVTAGLTRALMPWVAATPVRRGLAAAAGGAGVLGVAYWSTVVLFGFSV
ncbi:hypothetical protein QQX09_13285 [Demequina sp. SYSU T00192]|uniref:Uncharacterized protein n=1 Tax=Demequina litoralis TaxID=3051660 RepID=A0ABT8GCY1_9MICO|nr:hypothetical protein [Demequina sp. SYSU T00192]MDN4476827.1 hypothetical protein [Demequina sp. SYSU T00192]